MEIAGALIMAAVAGTTAAVEHTQAKHTAEQQAEAAEKAEREQEEADNKAEKQRLEALAADQTKTDYGNVWGIDSAKYTDAAQKLSAGTGSFNTDDDEENPFYTKGLM